MSAYINTVCARVTNTLVRLNKDVLTVDDVETALRIAGIDSTDGRRNYTKEKGYLSSGGWLIRCIGGWTLTDESKETCVITIKITPGLATAQVLKQLLKTLKPFEGFTKVELEV